MLRTLPAAAMAAIVCCVGLSLGLEQAVAQTATPTPKPEINVLGNERPIANGDVTPSPDDGTDFDSVPAIHEATNARGGSATRVFTIANTGGVNLNLTGPEPVTITGPHAGDFAVIKDAASPIAAGELTRFTIKFAPSATGSRHATVSIANSDDNESLYTFAIRGEGSARPGPKIDIVGNGLSIVSGDTTPSFDDDTNFGDSLFRSGEKVARTFTIKNTGSRSLMLFTVGFSRDDPLVEVTSNNDPYPTDFRLTSPPLGTIVAGGSTTFTIEYEPRRRRGLDRATVSISSTASTSIFVRGDAHAYTFAIQGNSPLTTPDREINVLSSNRRKSIVSGDKLPSPFDGTDFGQVAVMGGTLNQRFTITNAGSRDLNLTGTPRVAISGDHAGDFTISEDPTSPIEAESSTLFNILFKPKALGLRRATVTIANDDADENPYTFAIQGEGTPIFAPEIAVAGNGVSIVAGDTSPSVDDHTDFGMVATASGAADRTFTIANTGNLELNLTDTPRVTISGDHAGDFKISKDPISPIETGETTSFTITFDPSAAGARTATLSIANDDADENPYTFAIQGEGATPAAPEIAITGNGRVITTGDPTPSVDDHTDFGMVATASGAADRTFTIANSGNLELNLTDTPRVTISGDHAGDFKISQVPASPIATGETTSFTITFDPSAAGARTATLSIANDDADENPYTFAIQGEGATPAAPEIAITGNGRVITTGDPTPSVDDHTDFGPVETASGALDRTFTITNTGNFELNLTGTPRVTIRGDHAGDFALSQVPASPIATGETTSFTIRFDPSAAGARTATLSIANDDADENPYTFAIQGEGATPAAPEIAITGNGRVITTGDPTPSVDDHTDFGMVATASGAADRTFTIANSGNLELNLTDTPRVTISGDHAGDFKISQVPASPIATGETTSFTITFDPSAAGARTATLSIANDDADENPYTFAIQGEGATPAAPEIAITGNGRVITTGDPTPSVDDHTDFGPVETASGALDRTFTITNTGNFELNLTGTPRVTIRGDHAGDFALSQVPASPIATGETTSFTIRFDPSAAGARTATLSIANDDADENPYTFAIQGEGATPAAPEIAITGNGRVITTGDPTPSVDDHTDFGMVATASGALDRTFTIANSGNLELNLTDTPRVTISGDHAGDFALSQVPASPIATGETTSFTIRFDPSAAGARTATLSIANDDADENPYTFAIQGEGATPAAPEIAITGNGRVITTGDPTPSVDDHTDFGPVETASGALDRTFTITNTGNFELNLTGTPRVTIRGDHAGDFALSQVPASPIATGETTSFTITFDPSAAGARTATLSIANDDADENPYTFAIQGEGATPAAPEIAITGNGRVITTGDPTPSVDDHTDFGPIETASGALDRTFTIANSGNLELNLTGTPRVTIRGDHAGDFALSQVPASPIATGETTSFTITFDPSAAGARTATLSIANDDADENPYTFAIQGEGATPAAPEIAITGNGRVITTGDPTPSVDDHTDFGMVATASGALDRTFTIANSGNLELNLTDTPRVTIRGDHAGDFALSQVPASPIATGETTSFTITFDPSAAGARTATLSIANDDADENPYTFAIQGEGATPAAPEIAITGNGRVITTGDPTPSVDDHTDFGMVATASGALDRTFTIANSGNLELNLTDTPRVTISGDHAGDFALSQVPASPIATGETTSFTITFDPSAAGARTATLSIANDDADENPYTFAIQGEGATPAAPEIAITGNGRVITTGDPTPSVDDHTDFGPVETASGALDRTFTITNSGNLELNLTGTPRVTIRGDHAGDFALSQVPASPIATGETTSFTIRFDPSAAGARTATLSIANDDADENPYTFAIQGEGATPAAPEIAITGNGRVITTGDPTPSVDDHTDFGPVETASGALDRTFTITNTGNFELNLTDTPRVTIRGDHAGDFKISQVPASPIATGETTSFTITFDPSAAGARTATLSIANDDADENPYTFAIQGEGATPAAPEIAITGNGRVITTGDPTPSVDDHTDFGMVATASGALDRTFTIANSGNLELNLTDTPRVTIRGDHAGDFALSQVPASPIATGETTSFTITFDPSAAGARTATLSIANDDADENPYTFAIQGEGATPAAPEIAITGNGRVITTGDPTPSVDDHTDFGPVETASGALDRTFTITNSGNLELNLTGTPRVTIRGDHAGDFALSQVPASPIATGETTSFTIRFDPSAAGARTATLSIANDDADENPYTFAIQGEGATPAAPEIAITGNGRVITTGDPTPSVDDHTDFGPVETASGALDRTFTITNSGNFELNLTGTPRVTIRGDHAGDFALSQVPASPIATGETTSFTITFDPSAAGARTATLSIANDDADENPYTFAIQGEGDGTVEQQRSRRIISNFVRRRADQITANEPDLTSRLGDANAAGGPPEFVGEGSADTHRFTFAASLGQMLASGEAQKNARQAELAPEMTFGTLSAPGDATAASGFDIWVKGTRSKVKYETAATDFGLLSIGADYRVSADYVVGVLGQFDWTDEKDSTQNFKIDGTGWMIGPYVVARLHDNLVFDGRAAWGQSSNTVSPYSTYSDDFDTQRWLVKGQFTGDFQFGALHFAPHLGVIYFEERQQAFIDSLGNAIGQQKIEVGRATFGPKLSTSYRASDGTTISPYVGIKGIWDFKSTDTVDITTGLAELSSNAKLRARAEAGVSVHMPGGISIEGEAFFDGVGVDSFSAYGGGVTMRMPF